MSEWQLDHFSDQSHLSSATTDVFVSNIIFVILFVSYNWLSLSEQESLRSDDSVFTWLNSQDLKLYWSKVASDNESIANMQWS